MVCEDAFFQVSPISDYSIGILQHPISRNKKGIRKVNRMMLAGKIEKFYVKREIEKII